MLRRRPPPSADTTPVQPPRRRLGRRIAFVLVPLVILPSFVIGSAGYLRSREILESQAANQLTLVTQSLGSRMLEWGRLRSERLQIGTQRAGLQEAVAVLLTSPLDAAEQERQAVRAILQGLRSTEGQVLFSDVLIVDADSGTILASTRAAWEGSTLSPRVLEMITEEASQTRALIEDPVLAPAGLTLLTAAPMRTRSATEIDAFLVGANSGVRIGSLLQDMQVLQQQRGVFRVSMGETFLILQPDVVVRLPRYSTNPTIFRGLQAPIFDLPESVQDGTALYTGLDGEPVLGAYEWLPEWSMGVLIEISQEQIFGELDQLVPFIIGTIVIAVALTITITAFATNRMLRPLASLAEFAKRISQGEWLYRVPEDRDDELGAVAEALNQMAQEISGMYHSLEVRVNERTKQIRTASEVARAVTSVTALDDLLRRAVELIKDQFGYYHVSIFLFDRTGKYAILREATGEIGEALKARGHRLAVGSESVIGWVTANNQPRIASNVSEDPIHFKNEFLPQTQAEAAVPLRVADEVLGALDVQSTEVDAFDEEDIEVLQTLADQLSAAIQNARLAQVSVAAADRARLISDITTELSGLMEVDEVLRTAAHSLHAALGQPEVLVKLAVERDGAGGEPRFAPESALLDDQEDGRPV